MKELMFENIANTGEQIRAYDFAQFGEDTCYIEGTVLTKGTCDDKYYSCYKILLNKRIVKGKDVTEKTKDKIWYVPFETNDDVEESKRYPNKITRVMKVKGEEQYNEFDSFDAHWSKSYKLIEEHQ